MQNNIRFCIDTCNERCTATRNDESCMISQLPINSLFRVLNLHNQYSTGTIKLRITDFSNPFKYEIHNHVCLYTYPSLCSTKSMGNHRLHLQIEMFSSSQEFFCHKILLTRWYYRSKYLEAQLKGTKQIGSAYSLFLSKIKASPGFKIVEWS